MNNDQEQTKVVSAEIDNGGEVGLAEIVQEATERMNALVRVYRHLPTFSVYESVDEDSGNTVINVHRESKPKDVDKPRMHYQRIEYSPTGQLLTVYPGDDHEISNSGTDLFFYCYDTEDETLSLGRLVEDDDGGVAHNITLSADAEGVNLWEQERINGGQTMNLHFEVDSTDDTIYFVSTAIMLGAENEAPLTVEEINRLFPESRSVTLDQLLHHVLNPAGLATFEKYLGDISIFYEEGFNYLLGEVGSGPVNTVLVEEEDDEGLFEASAHRIDPEIGEDRWLALLVTSKDQTEAARAAFIHIDKSSAILSLIDGGSSFITVDVSVDGVEHTVPLSTDRYLVEAASDDIQEAGFFFTNERGELMVVNKLPPEICLSNLRDSDAYDEEIINQVALIIREEMISAR